MVIQKHLHKYFDELDYASIYFFLAIQYIQYAIIILIYCQSKKLIQIH